ncbi:MAG: glycerophosphodiester phosphodiesterase [Sulfurimonas sp. RIFOXYD12_FULL_33_39]|uniref:glycerophosphodiester phosphodiesterase n=1 Tax=unclassified Sulfurimonas TaxID=2623549 RepID=UPI0008C07E99|nr:MULTISPECIES: glycerophosphodiester phosphodiesterase family protein [unclassified Sulfurimonas]OHE09275.1 MAG: glycerophosphodiester phosphodiesterase [Sulfurimonas sp. RIFOXYD12_FULL_33_39]OHE12942.1 MAG: glycerophosphodiester phosphodiesterase [Sulfurimonas sp. RIFOXYD2_FULL_34_21]DAB27817.1 MAG TPA: glycerophosphodiester phosphodiesterase [Sulfurimonas sp. UBA10385]
MNFLKLLNLSGLFAAHRGARSIAPENTLLALKKSVGHCDFVEVDVQLSSDEVAIIMHDDTLERTTNISQIDSLKSRKPYRVCDFTFEELKTLDYGSWFYKEKKQKEAVLTLHDTLAFIKKNEMFINVEIKDMYGLFDDEKVVSIVIDEIKKTDMLQSVLISSFRHEYLKILKEKLPDIPTAVLVEDSHPDNLIEYLKELRADAYSFNNELADEKIVKKLREAGFYVGVYTVNDFERVKELFGMGVNYIFSDILYK